MLNTKINKIIAVAVMVIILFSFLTVFPATVSALSPNNWSRIYYGDVNGDGLVNQADVDLLLKYNAGLNVSIVFEAADLNGDGIINIADISTLQRYISGIETQIAPKKPLSITAQLSKKSISDNESLTIYAATSIPACGVEIYVDGNLVGIMNCTGQAKMNWSYTISGKNFRVSDHLINLYAQAPNNRCAVITQSFTIANNPSISVAAVSDKYSGTVNDKFNITATTNIAASRVSIRFDGNNNTYWMSGNSTNTKWNWLADLYAGNRVLTITAYDVNGKTTMTTLNIAVSTLTTGLDKFKKDYPQNSTWTGTYQPYSRTKCLGFAFTVSDLITGGKADNKPKNYYNNGMPNIKIQPGDIIYYNANSSFDHAIVVTAVSGDTVWYADCNFIGANKVNWEGRTKISTISDWLSKTCVMNDNKGLKGFIRH